MRAVLEARKGCGVLGGGGARRIGYAFVHSICNAGRDTAPTQHTLVPLRVDFLRRDERAARPLVAAFA